MTPVSSECARSYKPCSDCRLDGCGHDCHKAKNPGWKNLTKAHGQKRYFMGYSKSGEWLIFDRGTLQSTTTKKIATCTNRFDAMQMVYRLNKGVR